MGSFGMGALEWRKTLISNHSSVHLTMWVTVGEEEPLVGQLEPICEQLLVVNKGKWLPNR